MKYYERFRCWEVLCAYVAQTTWGSLQSVRVTSRFVWCDELSGVSFLAKILWGNSSSQLETIANGIRRGCALCKLKQALSSCLCLFKHCTVRLKVRSVWRNKTALVDVLVVRRAYPLSLISTSLWAVKHCLVRLTRGGYRLTSCPSHSPDAGRDGRIDTYFVRSRHCLLACVDVHCSITVLLPPFS